MGHTLIEKILQLHSNEKNIQPGDIIDIDIDTRVARDFGGANVVNNLEKYGLGIADPNKTCFTFDCNPGGSDQKYAANQQRCRVFARQHHIKVYDINCGIGTHVAIDERLIFPGGTFVSTDSHANIMGAIGAFGQGMGDQDIAAAWARGRVWFKVPPSVKVTFHGKPAADVTAKDVVLAMLKKFGANTLLGCSVEIYGDYVAKFSLSERITIASMATEMGAITLLFPIDATLLAEFHSAYPALTEVTADADAHYRQSYTMDLSEIVPYISRPGHPEDVVTIADLPRTRVDSVFIGSCTNGRFEDMQLVAELLHQRKVAPGVVLKIVPATNAIWERCLQSGLLDVFQKAGALIGNPGCAGCAAGQIGQNGPGEITISTGNRNFPGKQGGGHVYLASPATAIASAIAGFITTATAIPAQPYVEASELPVPSDSAPPKFAATMVAARPLQVRGRAWIINRDNIDTDMIYHNRYLAVVDKKQMGRYTFDNLVGWEDFANQARPGDIIFTGKNFGCGSSRQQAVDCFLTLEIGAIVAESFGAIYERNAINAALPILTLPESLASLEVNNGDQIELDFLSGRLTRLSDGKIFTVNPFFKAQTEIFQRGGLLTIGS